MSSVAKTTLDPDVSLLVDGQPADAGDVLAAINDLETYAKQGYSSVTASDANLKHLDDALAVGTGLVKAVQDGGADESLLISLGTALLALNALLPSSGKIQAGAMDSEAAPSGYVATANGSGGVSYAAVGGGGAQPIDLNGTAGEALAERDMVYLDEAAGTWKKIDTDAATLSLGRLTGCVNEAGGISSGAAGSIRILGEVSGFSSLTAWQPVYASTTAGGYTQTKPDPVAEGAQVAIKEMGFAVSTGIVFVSPRPALYMKRASVSNGGTLTVQHHADSQGHSRDLSAYISEVGAGATITEYASSNQDDEQDLKRQVPSGSYTADVCTGGTVIYSSFLSGFDATNAFDDSLASEWASNGTAGDQWVGYQFGSAKTIKRYTVAADPTPPAGQIRDWVFEYWDGAAWQAADTQAGVTSWGSSEVKTYDIAGDYSSTQWRIRPTANNGGSNHIIAEVEMMEAVLADGADRLAQGFQAGSNVDLGSVSLYLKKVGAAAGDLTVEIYSDSGGAPGTLLGTSATVAASALGTALGWTEFVFSSSVSLVSGTAYHMVLRSSGTQSNANYVAWGCDSSAPGYANGAGQTYDGAAWSAAGVDFIFRALAVGTQFESKALIGAYGSGQGSFENVYHDGAGADVETKTTIINTYGATLDVTAVVRLE